jgi:hypothetical protein
MKIAILQIAPVPFIIESGEGKRTMIHLYDLLFDSPFEIL